MKSVRFLAPAEAEMNTASRYYEQQVSGLGHQFLDEIEQAIQRIRSYPASGVILHDNIRRMLLGRFPFGLLYRIDAQEITFLAVAHLRRRPGYWKEREKQR